MTKARNFDEFKNEVYHKIGMLESLDSIDRDFSSNTQKGGCFGLLIGIFLGRFTLYANKKAREHLEFIKLSEKADKLIAKREIKDLLCKNLDSSVHLPIDAAYKITTVLYDLSIKDEENIPLNATLFAIICKKVTQKGIETYCKTT